MLKFGSLAFFTFTPRQDLMARMITLLQDAGFKTGFTSIYWTYLTGFAKISDTCKLLDKRAGAEIEIIGKSTAQPCHMNNHIKESKLGYRDAEIMQQRHDRIKENGGLDITIPATPEAQKFDGAYNGFNLKPATEVILVVMKSLSAKSYTEQALKNGHGISWLKDCKIPWSSGSDMWKARDNVVMNTEGRTCYGSYNTYDKSPDNNDRFPANLLVSDDALNNGDITHGTNDSGSFSRYFDLDAWFKSKLPEQVQKTYPCLIVPKPSKREKNKYCENTHPTVKPLKLMSYLLQWVQEKVIWCLTHLQAQAPH